MSLPTIQAIAEGLEGVLDAIPGLHVSDFKPDSIVPDSAIVGVPSWELAAMQRGVFKLDFAIVVLTSASFDRAGQHRLMKYADYDGDSSVIATVAANETLGLTGVKCTVLKFDSFNVEEIAAYRNFGGTFHAVATVSGA